MSEHGTRSLYSQGCRCDDCTAASTEYMRRRRAAQIAAGMHYVRGRLVTTPRRQRAPGEEPAHGTVARYVWSRGACRCDPCRLAYNASVVDRRRRVAARKS